MVRMWATGSPPADSCSADVTCVASVRGLLLCVRTIHQSGATQGIERGLPIRHLCQRDIHGRKGVAIRSIMQGADDSNDLTRWFSEGSAGTRRLLQSVPQRISLWPVLLRHGFVDEDHSGSRGIVVIGEQAAAQKRNLQCIEIAPRDGIISSSTSEGSFAFRPSYDIERHAEAALQRQSIACSRFDHTGDRLDAICALARIDLRLRAHFSVWNWLPLIAMAMVSVLRGSNPISTACNLR